MSDAIRRALRTFLWGLVALAGGVPAIAAAFDLEAATVAKVTAVFTVAVAVVTAIVNAAEDKGYLPALLKAPPSPGVNPVPYDAGQTVVGIVVAIIVAVLVLKLLGVI